ncbi:MAG: hypothetical protein UY48_C0008G0037 [Candidatus Gottesmanbacteria bacterium GW2011_GWB1_49_7]|uniref:Translation initiation factor IF-1 n=1 Tax=Candidatus Gottesmanbacteria bacterium GW2011_GWB1_49_7 TaxID=1618448 RepID=A0A0G1YD21_9BACT|nr:MAG: hypothetical protein UY48_C0008G0037 [Candidatus Gottesmanbacteria bacterium GW2011_GWB1_49_7]
MNKRQALVIKGQVIEIREDPLEGVHKIILDDGHQTLTFRTIRPYMLGDKLVLKGQALPDSIQYKIPETRLTEVVVHGWRKCS